MIKRLLMLAVIMMAFNQAIALDAITFSYGQGEPAQLRTGLLGVQWKLTNPFFTFGDGGSVIGLADAQIGYWSVNKAVAGNSSLTTFSVAAMIRIQKALDANNLIPYIEGGIGPAIYTHKNLAERKLGAPWGFENKIGVGLMFGESNQYDISYHYVKFSNYGLYDCNDSFAANWLLTFAWHIN